MSIADELRKRLLRDGDYFIADENLRQSILTVAKSPSVAIDIVTTKEVRINGNILRADNGFIFVVRGRFAPDVNFVEFPHTIISHEN